MTKRKIETLEIEEDGNTSPPQSPNQNEIQSFSSKKQCIQYKFHCFTWNNYPPEAIEQIEQAFSGITKRYVFQEELGENNTPHIQGTVETTKKTRATQFNLPKQVHWEKTRNVEAAFKYCAKPETKIGPTYSFGLPRALRLITNLYPWQQEIYDVIKIECMDDRTINWYWDSKGKIGKTQFVKYCCFHIKAIMITKGKTSDLVNAIFNADMDETNVVFIDIPRSGGNIVNYDALESIKNGIISNTKFETGMKLFNSPHVIVFANEPPDLTELSADRWNVVDLSKK